MPLSVTLRRSFTYTALFFLTAASLAVAQQNPAAVTTRRFKQEIINGRTGMPPLNRLRLQEVGVSFQQWQISVGVLERHLDLRAITGLTTKQIVTYGRVKDTHPSLVIHWDESLRVPIYMSGSPLTQAPTSFAAAPPEAALESFLDEYRELLRIEHPATEFTVTSTLREDDGGTTLRLAQRFRRLPMWGKDITVHIDRTGSVDLFTGRYTPTPDQNTDTHVIEASHAIASVLYDLDARGIARTLRPDEQSLLGYDGPQTQQVYLNDGPGKPTVPAWFVEIRTSLIDRWRYFVDARDGSIIRRYNAACADGPETAIARDLLGQNRTINTYLFQGAHYMIDASRPMFKASESVFPVNTVGTIVTLDARNTDLTSVRLVSSASNTWSDASTVSAQYNAAQTYEYYRTTHGRNAIDDNGSTIYSIVNVTQDGKAMDNAYWNGKFMMYGNGAVVFKPLAAALDVAAHEMTHGVTEHSANLEYLRQSGALNEAFSDIFAAMVDRTNWTIGEDIIKSTTWFPSGVLRSLSNPHNGVSLGAPAWQPQHMNEYQNLSDNDDQGGVHINSGIPNHAAWLAATDARLGTQGRDIVEKVFYRALTTKLTTQSQFIDFRLAIIKSAEELYPQNPAVAQVMRDACDGVGIFDGTPTKGPDDLPQIPGTDHLLFVSTDPTDPYYLWTVQPPAGANDFSALSRTSVLRKPSISDDGSIAVFIDGNRNLRAIALNPAAPNEQVIDASGIWNSVAISRNKRLLALTTVLNDTSIHVFDISQATPVLKSFAIYTPNYSNTSVPNVARFADAMDFSPGNETLLFDTYNEMTVDTSTVGFWDINIMNVWDKSLNAFDNGHIARIFPQQPGLDIGDPCFARNKQTVFTFDLQAPSVSKGYIMAFDLVKGGDAVAVTEVTYGEPGYPSYRGDDAVISFGNPNASAVRTIWNVPVGSDAMTPTGSLSAYLASSVYPVWYRIGQRPVSAAAAPSPVSVSLGQNHPNPFTPSTLVTWTLDVPQHIRLAVYDAMGREVAVLADALQQAGAHTAVWDGRDRSSRLLPAGVYLCRLTAGASTLTRRMVLVR